jgi:hypothetical protein
LRPGNLATGTREAKRLRFAKSWLPGTFPLGFSRPFFSSADAEGAAWAALPVAVLSFDLNLFIMDAAANGISSAWYLTDVFGGFQIWTGSDAVGLACTDFTCVVH